MNAVPDPEEALTLEILDSVQRNEQLSQRHLSRQLGVALGLAWPVGLLCLLAWVGMFRLSRISSVGGMSAALAALEKNQMPVELRGVARDMFDIIAPEMQGMNRVVLSNLWLFAPVVKQQMAQAQQADANMKNAKAAKDKELLSASMDAVSARWRSQAAGKGCEGEIATAVTFASEMAEGEVPQCQKQRAEGAAPEHGGHRISPGLGHESTDGAADGEGKTQLQSRITAGEGGFHDRPCLTIVRVLRGSGISFKPRPVI